MIMNRKDVINFAPEGIKSKKRFPFYVVLIVIAALLIGGASFAVILAKNDYDFRKTLGIRQNENIEETTEEELNTEISRLQETEGQKYNFLFVCAKNKDIDFCQLVTFEPAAKAVSVHPVSADMVLKTAKGENTVKSVFAGGGIGDLIAALEKNAVSVSRYVLITEDNFVSLIQTLGAVDMMLEKDFAFAGDDLKYTFDAGRIAMNADALLQYMKFASSGDELLRLQSEAAAAIIRTHFVQENTEKGEEFFSRIINLVKTDISAFDYTAAAPVIKEMAEAGIEITVVL